MQSLGITRAQIAVWSLAVVVVLALGTAVADAMVETDVERLDEVARVLSSDRAATRVDGLLAYADPAREPVYVTAGRSRQRIDDAADLPDALHDALGALDRDEGVELLDDDVAVRGETGTVSVAARVDGRRVQVMLTLRREGQGWLLSGVRAY